MSTIREKAEGLATASRADVSAMSQEDVQAAVYELQVHQIELDLQNEELRQAQFDLAEARDRYIDLYEFAPVGYFTLDEGCTIRQANLTASSLLHADRSKLVGRRLQSLVTPASQDDVYRHFCAVTSSQAKQVCQLQVQRLDGTCFFGRLETVPARGDVSKMRFWCTLSDVTDLHDAVAELQALNETLEQRVTQRTAEAEQRTAQLRDLAAEITQAEQRERRQIAQLLHDHLQQMLVAARLQLGQVRRRTQKKAKDEALAEVDALLQQSLDESRSLTAQLSPPVLYDRGLAAGLEWLVRQAQEKYHLAVTVATEAAAEPADEAVKVFLFTAVREMLLNVAKHARARHAWVTMGRRGDARLRIEVRDDGVGFDPHQEASSATSGFGMFSIRERLRLLGGQMEITSSPGQGTRMAILMPSGAAAAAHAPLAATEPAARPAPTASQRLRVLVADDHPLLRKGLADILHEQAEIELVGEARDGQEAVEMAAELHPDIILMDMTMPRLNGIEATRHIHANLPAVRVIGLSMHESEDMAAAMREAGAVAYVNKSEAADTLLATILASAGRGGQTTESCSS